MPKHRWRESLKSFLGSYIDPEKDGELRGAKAEIDGKVQKILKFLKEEDGGDRKEPLANLLEEFHNHYQSLYARYDNLTEELRKKAQGKRGTHSSSSSSDSSDADDSPNKMSKKNGEIQGKFEKDTAVVKQELEMALSEVGDLKRELAATVDEKEALYLEYQNALSQAQEAQRIIMDLNAEGEAKSKLLTENAELTQKLEDMNSERENLIAGQEAAFIKIEEEKRNVEELRAINGQLQHERDSLQLELQAANERVKDLEQYLSSTNELKAELEEHQKERGQEISEFRIQIETLKNNLENRIAEQQKAVEEKENLELQLKDLNLELNSVSSLKHELEEHLNSLGAQKNEADVLLEKKNEQISEFLIQLEKLKEELSSKTVDGETALEQKESLAVELKDLQLELENLHRQKSELEDQICSKLNVENQLREEKEVLGKKISEYEKTLVERVDEIIERERKTKEQHDAFMKLSEEYRQLEVEFQKCAESLKSSEKKVEEMTEQFQKDMDAKNQDVDQLEENIEDLKRELEIKVDEMNSLVENMRSTEVKQRLTSQKLRITEQLLGEKEEIHQKRVEKLQEEQKLLEDRIGTQSGIIATYKEAQEKMVTEISDKVNDTLVEIDTFSVKFEEDYCHLESRIYEVLNEVKVATNWITGNNDEKDELKREVASLLQQLRYEKEQVFLLTVKVGELERMLEKDEEDMKQKEEKMGELAKVIQERDEKMGELERKMKEKDYGILTLSEEKREAIRQLCVLIDYHHNRYDDLKDMILKTRGGRQTT